MNNPTFSKLQIKTFDGSLFDMTVTPNGMESSVAFNMAYYDYDGDQSRRNVKLRFQNVVAIDFEVNLFDNFVGGELGGFYEIFQEERKKKLVEKVFNNRLDGFLCHGDYHYDPDEKHDMLNWRHPMDELFGNLQKYHLYQQQTQGGVYYILASGYEMIER